MGETVVKMEMGLVRRLARKIKDIHQFEQIMADVDPAMRQQVRELLIPLLPFKVPDAE